jgi:hypothetical protein
MPNRRAAALLSATRRISVAWFFWFWVRSRSSA